MANIFIFDTLMSSYIHPWRSSIEEGKLKILLDNYERRVGILYEYIIVWKREASHPYLVREPKGVVVGEVILDAPPDVVMVIDQYEFAPRKNYRVEEKIRLENGNIVDAFVYVWRGDNVHESEEEFKTLLPQDKIPKWASKELEESE